MIDLIVKRAGVLTKKTTLIICLSNKEVMDMLTEHGMPDFLCINGICYDVITQFYCHDAGRIIVSHEPLALSTPVPGDIVTLTNRRKRVKDFFGL